MSSVVRSPLRAGARLSAMITLVLVAVVLAGWLFADGRTNLLPLGLQGMRPNAAVGFGLLAIGWFLPVVAARVLAVLALAVAATSLAAVVVQSRTGLEIAFGLPHPSPGRVTLVTGIALGALAGARLLPRTRRHAARAAEAVGFAMFAAGMVAVLGYLLYARSFYATGPLSTLALPCALALVLCSFAALADVEDGFAFWAFHGADAGAVLLRRVLPICLTVPPLLAFAAERGTRAGWFEPAFTLAAAIVSSVAICSLALVYTARALRRSDDRRARAASALVSVGDDLERRVREQSAEIVADRTHAAVLADRERIAADMHDLVIQRLFAVAIDLQGRASDGGVVDVDAAVDGLDAAIRDLRHSIFDLRSTPALGLDAALRDIVDGAAMAFPTAPSLTLSGALDAVPAPVAAHLLAATREGVSNAARHARARHLGVDVGVEGGSLTLTVVDDGVGIDPAASAGTGGRRNMADRAAQLGGWCAWSPAGEGGTALVWRVPLGDTALDPRSTRTSRLTAAMRAVTAEIGRAAGGESGSGDRLAAALDGLRAVGDADISALVTPDGSDLRVAATRGFGAELDPVGARLASAEAVSTTVIASMTPLRIDDADSMPVLAGLPGLGLGSALLLPVDGPGTQGVMVLARAAGRVPFSQADENAAMVFAAHVSALLALGPEVEGMRAWPRTEYDYSDVLTRPSAGLRPFHGLPAHGGP